MNFTPRAAMAALAIFASTSAQQAPLKVAYVNVEDLMSKAPGRPAAESTFQKQNNLLNAQFSKMTDSAKALEDKYTVDEPKLTQAEKDKRQKAIADFEQGLQAKHDEFTGQLEKLKQDLMLPLQASVKDMLEDLRKEEGYAIIFDNSQGPIAVADKNLDITDKALAKMLAKPNASVKRPVCTTPPCSPPE